MEQGINPADNIRQQLTPAMVDAADRVIVIASKESWPPYLGQSPKVDFWDIPNAVGMTSEAAHQIYDQVKQRVLALVEEIG